MFKPMPSPNGTNHSQLYMPVRAPHAAYDSKFGLRRMARDATHPDDAQPVVAELHKKILAFLKDKIDAADLFDVKLMLTGEDVSGMDAGEPPDFGGKPLVGGGQTPLKGAMDGLRFRARIHASERVSSDAHHRLRQHMNRIGVAL